MGFGLIANAILLTEIADDQKAAILQKVQHILARDLAINTSFRALYNFFLGMDPRAGNAVNRLPAEGETELLQDLKAHGYDLHGDYKDNERFWTGVLTPAEYELVTSHRLPQAEEDEAEIYAGADAGEYSSLANIGGVENEEVENASKAADWQEAIRRRAYNLINQRFQQDSEEEENTPAMNPESHPLYPEARQIRTMMPADLPRRAEPAPDKVPYASLEQEEHWVDPVHILEDYKKWMRVIHAESKARGVNINTKRNFEDIAFEMLDNDPKMDLIGANEEAKAKLVNILWQQHRVMIAQNKAEAVINFKSFFARPEENQEYEEQTSGAYQQAQDACLDHWRGVVRGVPKNPYAKGTRRHGQWEQGWEAAEKGVWDKRHNPPSKEEEESGFAQQFRVNNDLPASYENEEEMKVKPVSRMFKLKWKSGKHEYVQGKDIAHAFSKAGYGATAIQALDQYEEIWLGSVIAPHYDENGGGIKSPAVGQNVDTVA
jgi:hypothetical protein